MIQNVGGYLFRIQSFLFSILLEGNHGPVLAIIDNGVCNRLLHDIHNRIIILCTNQSTDTVSDFLGTCIHPVLCTEPTSIGRASILWEVHIGGSNATSITAHDHLHSPVPEYRNNGISCSQVNSYYHRSVWTFHKESVIIPLT